jgi:hypothetical protein
MLEECVDNLELATKQLAVKINQLEEEESQMLLNETSTESMGDA